MEMPDYKVMYEAEHARYEELVAKLNDVRLKYEDQSEVLRTKINLLAQENEKLSAQLDIVRLIFG